MARRGDTEHTYRKYVRELQAGTTQDRIRYLYQELESLWWKMNDGQRARVTSVSDLRKSTVVRPDTISSSEPEAEPAPTAPTISAEDEEARRRWEAEVDARIAAARARMTDPARDEAGQQATTDQEEIGE